MTEYDAFEQAWKNGYLAAIKDIKNSIVSDQELYKQCVLKLLYDRHIETVDNLFDN